MKTARELNSHEIKEKLLDMLVCFDEFCKKNNLRYYLAYGTLLGAIRHGGFIPWDDDVDICMPYEDYCKLVSLDIGPNYGFISKEVNRKYKLYYGKIYHKKTTLDTKYMKNCGFGIFIDVFPMFETDISDKDQTNYKRMMDKFSKFMYYCDTKAIKPLESKIKNFGKRIVYGWAKIFGSDYWLNKIDNLFKKYYKPNAKKQFLSGREIFDYNDFSSERRLKFEDKFFNIPCGAEHYLSTRYGDYMKLPPVNQRVSNHDFKVFTKEE